MNFTKFRRTLSKILPINHQPKFRTWIDPKLNPKQDVTVMSLVNHFQKDMMNGHEVIAWEPSANQVAAA